MSAVHFIEREKLFKKVSKEPVEYESGFWALSPDQAQRLVGARIYFHERQIEASYYGGLIISFRLQADGEYSGRIVFRFKPLPECRDVMCAGGWDFEKKIVAF